MNFKFLISNFQFPRFGSIIFLILISLMPLIPLLQAGLPITHDGQDHVARIANFYDSLSEGNLIPRWAGNLNWGYGHPILMFLYPLPSYAASLFHYLGFSLVDSTKLVFATAFIASGIAMYLWLREFLGEYSALTGAILYNFAPYRFVDLYVRGAIGEHVAFIFPPLILYFLLKLSKKYSHWYIAGGALSLAGLILSHNAITLMFLPFIILYGLYLIAVSKDKKLLSSIYSLVTLLGFGLSSFFLIPAFLEGRYTLRDIVATTEYASRFVKPDQLLYGPWSFGGTGEFTVQIGILNWILIIGSLFMVRSLFRKDKKLFYVYLVVLAFFVGSLFLMLKESDFIWKIITTLQKFQFPWRFLSVSVFAAAVLGAFSIHGIRNENIKKVILMIIVAFSILLTKDYGQAKDYLQKPEAFYTGIYESTTDTGESSPIWSVRFMEQRPKDTIEVIEGEAEIRKISRTSTHHKYQIEAPFKSRVRENTLYFPGWKVYIDGKEYKGVQFHDPDHRGLMTFYVLEGQHAIDIKFEETKLRQTSNAVSIVSFGLLGVIGFLGRFKLKIK